MPFDISITWTGYWTGWFIVFMLVGWPILGWGMIEVYALVLCATHTDKDWPGLPMRGLTWLVKRMGSKLDHATIGIFYLVIVYCFTMMAPVVVPCLLAVIYVAAIVYVAKIKIDEAICRRRIRRQAVATTPSTPG